MSALTAKPFTGLYASMALVGNGYQVAAESPNRSVINVYDDTGALLRSFPGTNAASSALWPSITSGPEVLVAYQRGNQVAVGWADGSVQMFGITTNWAPCIRWASSIAMYVVAAVDASLQKRIWALDPGGRIYQQPPMPAGNSRNPHHITPSGTVLWNDEVPYGQWTTDNHSLVCQESDYDGQPALVAFLGTDRSHALIAKGPAYQPMPVGPLDDGSYRIVTSRPVQVWTVTPPFTLVPFPAPAPVPPPPPPPGPPPPPVPPVPPVPPKPPAPGGPPRMTAYDEGQVNGFVTDARDAYATPSVIAPNGRPLDFGAMIWAARMQFDAVSLGYPTARAKQLALLRKDLRLDPP